MSQFGRQTMGSPASGGGPHFDKACGNPLIIYESGIFTPLDRRFDLYFGEIPLAEFFHQFPSKMVSSG